jgi:hypothetical protein
LGNGYRVRFTHTTDLAQRLQTAGPALSLESIIEKLDKCDLIILDDLCHMRRDQAETSALTHSCDSQDGRGVRVWAYGPDGMRDRECVGSTALGTDSGGS